jgi:hypothetical protein
MGCNCGKNRVGARTTVSGTNGQKATFLGYQVCYPDGTCTPKDQPIFSMVECRTKIREAGGGTVHRLLKPVA